MTQRPIVLVACRKCRHVVDEQTGDPLCGHPLATERLPDYYNGQFAVVTRSVTIMRSLGRCGEYATLFEPKEPEESREPQNPREPG